MQAQIKASDRYTSNKRFLGQIGALYGWMAVANLTLL
jgi:hypothetical protein